MRVLLLLFKRVFEPVRMGVGRFFETNHPCKLLVSEKYSPD
ncbi:hypothetical protein M135_3948 [Bacteroides fragilis str. S36L5]|uniref:Uncharacterized protein n=1 Tax=Bacteroides fragilis str. 3783N1-6 TaxID=1339310 RepID=A0AB73AHG4_BACFG|nr:hypothetical protein M126_3809 [Bacteroides fragilis str. S6L3]EYA89459.1 hypothetical protein M135_3948 [Bacteroides fragilis str. S36L5]EYB08351.1 hypothetical protein M119_3581 [Bacteroides fragilis str. 3783N1-6]KXU42956.1 hypothetical protein HMPREF2530_03347 [Bacteroides fragilis]KXU43078.1 hypothetical protein HMPREF2533_03347 [Bacteroides fragilis]